jgi:hypothetical protein
MTKAPTEPRPPLPPREIDPAATVDPLSPGDDGEERSTDAGAPVKRRPVEPAAGAEKRADDDLEHSRTER